MKWYEILIVITSWRINFVLPYLQPGIKKETETKTMRHI